jgi:glutathione S-transferase
MSDLILHHYPMSPFSEKIRSMLGYTQLHWQSAITREMPPRPILKALAGGYRKIPVAQIGADIFCDSKTIAAEISVLSGKSDLALENCNEEIRAYVSDVELNIFMASVISGGTKAFGRKILRSMSLLDIARFTWDRVDIGRKASVKSSGLRNPKQAVQKHLSRMEEMLKKDFLFGMQPSHADFSTYHCLWFIRDLGESPMINDFPKTIEWMNRMKAFGHGRRMEIDSERALEMAKGSTPRKIAAENRTDPLIGRKVHVSPSDYAQVPTSGILVGATPTQWVLAREEGALGTLHVHFPRVGFRLGEA